MNAVPFVDQLIFELNYNTKSSLLAPAANSSKGIHPKILTLINEIWGDSNLERSIDNESSIEFPSTTTVLLKNDKQEITKILASSGLLIHSDGKCKITFDKTEADKISVNITASESPLRVCNEKTTGYFRFPHLYHSILSSPSKKNERVLIIGPGLMPKNFTDFDLSIPEQYIHSPQLTELMHVYFIKNRRSTQFFVADCDSDFINSLQGFPNQSFYLPGMLATVPLKNAFIQDQERYKEIIGKILDCYSSETGAKPDKPFSFQTWDPSVSSSPFDRMDAIIATKSVMHAFHDFLDNEDLDSIISTWQRLIQGLNYGGTLYIDDLRDELQPLISFKELIGKLNHATNSQLSYQILTKPFSPNQTFITGVLRDTSTNKLKGWRAGTADLLAITRHLPPEISSKLKDNYSKPTADCYWHYVVKTKIVENPYPFTAQLKALEAKLGLASYDLSAANWTPLHVAVLSNNPGGITYLLQKEADPLKKDDKGLNPIQYAEKFFPDLLPLFEK